MEVTMDDTCSSEEIAVIASEIWNECYQTIITQEQIDYMVGNYQSADAIDNDKKNGYRYFVVRLNGEPAGYISLLPEENDVLLSKIYVFDRLRGTGIADRVMEFIEDFAAGKEYITLNVARTNYRAIAFYRKKGFVIAEWMLKCIGDGFYMDDHVMRLYLK